jgi:hypothetical protein
MSDDNAADVGIAECGVEVGGFCAVALAATVVADASTGSIT